MDPDNVPAAVDGGSDPAPLPDDHAEPGSLRERLEATYDAIQARESDAPAPSTSEPSAASPAQAAPPGRERDPAGKFAAKISAPEWLDKSAGVDWNRLPRGVQEALAKLTPPAAAAPAQPAPQAAQGAQQPTVQPPPAQTAPPPQAPTSDPWRGVVDRYGHHFTTRGIAPEQGIQTLLDTYERLQQSPETVLPWLARQYGVDLARIAGQQAPQQTGYMDPGTEGQPANIEAHPVVRALRDELAQLRGTTDQVATAVREQQRMMTARQIAEASAELQRFGNDPQNPRPHFAREDVRNLMSIYMRSGQASDLAAAYDMAVYSIPETRQALLAELTAKEREEAAREAQRRADEAKRQVIINARTRATAGVQAQAGQRASIRDTMERVAAGMAQ